MKMPWEENEADDEDLENMDPEILEALSFVKAIDLGGNKSEQLNRVLVKLRPACEGKIPQENEFTPTTSTTMGIEEWAGKTDAERNELYEGIEELPPAERAEITRELDYLSANMEGNPFAMPMKPFDHARMLEWCNMRNAGDDTSFLIGKLLQGYKVVTATTVREVAHRLNKVLAHPNLPAKAKQVLLPAKFLLGMMAKAMEHEMETSNQVILCGLHRMNHMLPAHKTMEMRYHNDQETPPVFVHGHAEYYARFSKTLGIPLSAQDDPLFINFLPQEEGGENAEDLLEKLAHVTKQGMLEDMRGGLLGSWAACVTRTHWIFRNPLALLQGFEAVSHEAFTALADALKVKDFEAVSESTEDILRMSLKGTVPFNHTGTHEENLKLIDEVWTNIVNAMLKSMHRKVAVEGDAFVLRATDGNQPVLARCGKNDPFLIVPTLLEVI